MKKTPDQTAKLPVNSPDLKVGDRVTIPGTGKDSFGVITELLERRCMHQPYYVITTDSGKVVTHAPQDYVGKAPVVGMGFSYGCWTDVYPGSVVEVSKSGRQMTIQDDEYVFAGEPGTGGPGGVQKWDYYPNPDGRKLVFKLNAKGRWIAHGSYSGSLGHRRYYHDYSF
jgi:hypothetical protein